jgi:hypothetical protein
MGGAACWAARGASKTSASRIGFMEAISYKREIRAEI